MNESGRFMNFETLTYVPIDLDGIDTAYLTEEDRQALNEYHAMVRRKLSPWLSEEERAWLKEAARAV